MREYLLEKCSQHLLPNFLLKRFGVLSFDNPPHRTLNPHPTPHQDRDFCLLHPGDPLFQTFSGETLKFKGKEPLYPFFINECAYYEKGIAVSLARKKRVLIPPVRVLTEEEQQAYTEDFESEEEE